MGPAVHRGTPRIKNMSRDERTEAKYVANPATTQKPTATNWENGRDHSHKLDFLLQIGLCNLNLRDCPYIIKSTAKHFHYPPEKCPVNSHEHCVSRSKPFPLPERCLLANSQTSFLNHKCCPWSAADMREASIIFPQQEHFAVREARKRGSKLLT